MIEADRDAIAEKLALVDGQAEFGLRIGFPRQAALDATLASRADLAVERRRLMGAARPPHMAMAEFGRRLAEALDRRRGAVQKALVASIVPRARAHVLAVPESDVDVLNLHLLIAPARIEAVAAMAGEAAVRSGFAPGAEPSIRIVGPVPPFNFVQLAIGAARSEAA
jgi:hypothetical protein